MARRSLFSAKIIIKKKSESLKTGRLFKAAPKLSVDSLSELSEENAVEDVFQIFLSAAARQFRCAELFRISGEFFQSPLVCADLAAQFAIP